MPFDRVTELGPGFIACSYDVQVGGLRDAESAARVVFDTRERVRAGRAQRPDAAHYVNVIANGPLDDSVRAVLVEGLRPDGAIDSVAFSGLPPSNAQFVEPAAQPRSNSGDGWDKVAAAIETDSTLQGKVLKFEEGEPRVDIDGAVGVLQLREGEAPPAVGETVQVRAIMLNLKLRRLVVVRVR